MKVVGRDKPSRGVTQSDGESGPERVWLKMAVSMFRGVEVDARSCRRKPSTLRETPPPQTKVFVQTTEMGHGRRRGMLRRRKWHLPCPQGRRPCSGEWGWHIGRPKRGVDRLFRERWTPFGRVDWSAPQHLTAPRDPPIHTENTGRHRRGDRGGTRGPLPPTAVSHHHTLIVFGRSVTRFCSSRCVAAHAVQGAKCPPNQVDDVRLRSNVSRDLLFHLSFLSVLLLSPCLAHARLPSSLDATPQ